MTNIVRQTINKLSEIECLQSANHARALRVDSELFWCPYLAYILQISQNLLIGQPILFCIGILNSHKKFWKLYRASHYRLSDRIFRLRETLRDTKEKRPKGTEKVALNYNFSSTTHALFISSDLEIFFFLPNTHKR